MLEPISTKVEHTQEIIVYILIGIIVLYCLINFIDSIHKKRKSSVLWIGVGILGIFFCLSLKSSFVQQLIQTILKPILYQSGLIGGFMSLGLLLLICAIVIAMKTLFDYIKNILDKNSLN